jgi:hypothetical protein
LAPCRSGVVRAYHIQQFADGPPVPPFQITRSVLFHLAPSSPGRRQPATDGSTK